MVKAVVYGSNLVIVVMVMVVLVMVMIVLVMVVIVMVMVVIVIHNNISPILHSTNGSFSTWTP